VKLKREGSNHYIEYTNRWALNNHNTIARRVLRVNQNSRRGLGRYLLAGPDDYSLAPVALLPFVISIPTYPSGGDSNGERKNKAPGSNGLGAF
jgi:hypothetical protein